MDEAHHYLAARRRQAPHRLPAGAYGDFIERRETYSAEETGVLMRLCNIIALSALTFPWNAVARENIRMSCDQIWKDPEGPSYCYTMPPTDATTGILLEIGQDGRLAAPLGRYDFVDTQGNRHHFKVDNGVYQPFETRFALADGRIVELYDYDALAGVNALFLEDATHTYRPFPGLPTRVLRYVPIGTY